MRLLVVSLAAFAALAAEDHPLLPLPPGSSLAGGAGVQEDGEMVLSFRGDEGRVRETVEGRHWSLEYDVPPDVTRDAIVAFFEKEADELEGGEVLRRADNRLTFRFRRPDGGVTWCDLWATDGMYALEIVDAAVEASPPPPEPEGASETGASAGEAPELLGSIGFEAGSATLAPGSGATLDAVAVRAHAAPERRLELRSARSADGPEELAERRAQVVAEALALYGVAASRLDVTISVSDTRAGVDVYLFAE